MLDLLVTWLSQSRPHPGEHVEGCPLSLLEWAKNEAETRGLPSGSALVRQLLETEQDTTAGTPVVSVEQLHQLINQIARRSSAA